MKPKRIYVRARLLSFSDLKDDSFPHSTRLVLFDQGACGFLVAYSSRGKFERAHPGEKPMIFEIVGPTTLEKGIGACPVCSKAFKLNSAGRVPAHGAPGDRCDGAKNDPKIDGPRVQVQERR